MNMPTKKTELEAKESIAVQPELEEMLLAESAAPQTDLENPLEEEKMHSEGDSFQTEPGPDQVNADPEMNSDPNTPVLQTEPEEEKKPRRRRKTGETQSQSDTEEEKNSEEAIDDAGPGTRTHRTNPRTRPAPIVAIDDRPTVETDADKARNDLLDLLESQKTGRILTGTVQGIERPADNPTRSLAVIYHGEFKIIIPAEEAVEPPEDFRGRLPEDVLHYMLTKRLGAEVDYIVKGLDPKAGLAVGSRLEAMRQKRRQYYLGVDREGNNLLYSGVCAEARVVSVIRAGIFVDLFGLEIYIPLRELSYQRLMDAAGYFQPGQRILVKILDVDRSDRNNIRATASVKQAGENPYEKALRKYTVGNRYVGTVSMVDTNGVFVALDGGIDCLCSYPKRGRPPRGARVTVRILGINNDTNRIWGAITHIAAAR